MSLDTGVLQKDIPVISNDAVFLQPIADLVGIPFFNAKLGSEGVWEFEGGARVEVIGLSAIRGLPIDHIVISKTQYD